jgi:excisionase family DNA binding protein
LLVDDMDQPPPSHDRDGAGSDGGEAWLTTLQAAEQTGKHRETIRRWIRNGVLESRDGDGPGGQQEVRRSDLMALVEKPSRGRSTGGPQRAERSQILLPGDRTVVLEEPSI